MGGSVPGDGSAEQFFVGWRTSSARECASLVSGNYSFALTKFNNACKGSLTLEITGKLSFLRSCAAEVFDLTWSLATSDAEWNFVTLPLSLPPRDRKENIPRWKSEAIDLVPEIFIITFLQ